MPSRGSSIIELLVATALTAILLVGVIAIFLSWRSSSETATRLSITEEAGQRALEALAMAIRSADFPGCVRAPAYSGSSLAPTSDPRWDLDGTSIHGYPSAAQSEMQPYATNASPESPMLFVRGVRSATEALRLAKPMATPSDPLSVMPSASRLQPGDVAMIHSCTARAYFAVTDTGNDIVAHDEPANRSSSLGYVFDTDAEILPLSAALFYVGGRTESDPPALWRRVGDSAPEEIVRGVESLQLEYGVDGDADGVVDEYRNAADVTDWRSVLSVGIELRVRSADLLPPARTAHTVGSVEDEVRSFSTIVSLRNRALAD